MAMEYTEEQLNHFDKSTLVQPVFGSTITTEGY